MFIKHTATRRTTVDADTRRHVAMSAASRKPQAVALVPHEAFIRQSLKDLMNWPRREPAPDTIKVAAKEMASFLVARDIKVAIARAAARDALRDAEAAKAAEGVAEAL